MGDYKVTVTKVAKDTSPAKTREEINQESLNLPVITQAPPPADPQSVIPQKYAAAATTPWQFTVKAGENEDASFELVD